MESPLERLSEEDPFGDDGRNKSRLLTMLDEVCFVFFNFFLSNFFLPLLFLSVL
jgi:hypothetical protein